MYDIQGSPPQVRGKLLVIAVAACKRRITPAGAGKTSSGSLLQAVCWDHPRRCGENCSLIFALTSMPGSPPQVRGKLYRAAGIAEKYRITPAGAGKTR